MRTELHRILVEHDLCQLPPESATTASRASLVTLLSNVAYYGYGLSEPAYAALSRASDDDLAAWWSEIEPAFRAITGDDKDMASFVVYKNFPAEVLAMSELDYWTRQILMYWGFPNELFTEAEKPREEEAGEPPERLPAKILHPAGQGSLLDVQRQLLHSPVRWTDRQWETVQQLCAELDGPVAAAEVPFKENMVKLVAMLLDRDVACEVATATDVLRLAAGLSDGDVSLREPGRLRRFARKERRFLLGLLESAGNLLEDLARRRELFKRLFRELRPGDYADRFPRVVEAYDIVYRGTKVPSHAAALAAALAAKDPAALDLLASRPGDFVRRLRVATRIFGADAARTFGQVMPKLTTTQLVKLERYLRTVNERSHRLFPPRGNWSKLQIKPMTEDARFDPGLAGELAEQLARLIGERVTSVVPSVDLSADVERVKLQSSDSDLTPYGRGTVFPIPDNITFLRTASYWQSGPTGSNLWYDNSWNFFNSKWEPLGACCWNAPKFDRGAAVFSGDPTNSKDLEGRACQLIDLYLDKLQAANVRYAVWSLLCYSRRTFDAAVEVFAALQWGEKPAKKKLFEPSRCAFSFPVAGASMTKFVAYVDVVKRELVFIDANLPSRVSSAMGNQKILQNSMPAFVEYLAAQPSVHDLFKSVAKGADGMPVLYDDSDRLITGGPAYVFAPRNRHSQFEPFSLDALLSAR